MLGTNLRGGSSHESGQRGDELAGLIQVLEFLGILLGGKAELDGRRAHQVHSGGGDDLNGGDLGDVADLLRDLLLAVPLTGGGLENV